MLPELTFGEHVCIPAFYGKQVTARLIRTGVYEFSYNQPELITKDEQFVNGLGSCKVKWVFQGNKITSDFTFMVKNQIQMDSMRYMLAISAPHSNYTIGTSFKLGAESHRCSIVKDDFQASWQDIQAVSNDTSYKTYTGKIHYLQTLSRNHPLVMRPAQQYRLQVTFEPDIALAEE